MQGADRDAAYAAAVLDGSVRTTGAWRQRDGRPQRGRQQQNRQGGSGGRGASACGSGSTRYKGSSRSDKPSRHGKLQQRQQQAGEQQQERRQAGRGGGPPAFSSSAPADAAAGSNTASEPAAGDGVAAYNQPGPRSTPRVAHCQACDVWVPRRAGDWEVHTAGIRHRRQLLSLRVHGERNRLVLSTFESLPDSAVAAQRLVGKAAADFGLASLHSSSGGSGQAELAAAAPPELAEVARKLRTDLLKQLLNMFGVGYVYNAAAACCHEERLQQEVWEVTEGPWRATHSGGGSIVCRCDTGPQLAAVAHLARTGQLRNTCIGITMAALDCSRAQHACLAAALMLLLPALQRSGTLDTLEIVLQGFPATDSERVSALWQQGWQHALPCLRSLLESSVSMRLLHLRLPRCLQQATDAFLPQLHAAAAAAPAALRSHLLLALHPRLGRCSLLQLLPLEVLRKILDLAAPLQPCAVQLEWMG